MSLYNFRIDEDTFNKLVAAQVDFEIEGRGVKGALNMNKVLLAQNFKMEASIPLEKTIYLEEKKVEKKKPTGPP